MTRRAGRLRLVATAAGRGRSVCTDRWALLIARKYSLSLPEARAELRRLAAHGWMSWEFHARFDDDRHQ
ncbi:hypothetical protein F3K34_27120 [Streptomyces sp. LBUM 1486]|uniref:hypothetical protein n=1 Tax=Streptomyces scabiei TaxID=1930 RepID=UPI001B323537|nr:hypothetical protein [Streptomyces sp. LBUM 1486]MBP5915736.1 hypothetical protein [Streptomyces sp. LBUM 1486]